jgi:hypothetical protein
LGIIEFRKGEVGPVCPSGVGVGHSVPLWEDRM